MPKMSLPVSPVVVALPARLAVPRAVARALLALTIVAVLPHGAAWADKADRSQPVVFAADAARVDESKRVNILTGNVELTKGTMLIRADRVEVRQNADGTQTATATGGQGGRSYFKQKREGVDEVIEGEAEKIVYEGRDDTVNFTDMSWGTELFGPLLLTEEILREPLMYRDFALEIPRRPGLGIDIDEDKLARMRRDR